MTRAGFARSNVFWAGLEAGASASLSFAAAFVIARLIGPAEIGVGAAAVALHLLLWVGVNALFADALVQQPEISETDASSAFWASCLTGAAAAAAQVAGGVVLAAALADSRLAAMGLVLALPLPLVGAGGAVQGVLTRRRDYRVLAARALVGQGAGAASGVGAALAGAGAWAMVAQQAAGATAGALALLIAARWRPRPVLRWPNVRALLRTGLPLTAGTLVQTGRYRLFAMLIGVTAGPAALGMVHLAFRLVDTVRDLALTAQWRLMLPAMARWQDDLPRLQDTVDRDASLVGLVMFPAIGAMAVSLRPLVRIVLGPVWEPAATAALPLLGLMAWLFLGFAGGVALVARGGARHAMSAQIATAAATLLGVALLRPATPLSAVCVWSVAQLLVAPYLVWRTARAMEAPLFRQHRAGLPALALAALATALALSLPPASLPEPSAAALLVRLAALGGAYAAGALLVLRAGVADALCSLGLRARPS